METDSTSNPNLDLRVRGDRSVMAPLHLDFAARTDVGREREHNEDSLFIARPGHAGSTLPCEAPIDVAALDWVALGVCDGMGGAAAGEIASRSAVAAIGEILTDGGALTEPSELGHRLIESLQIAAQRVHADATRWSERAGMGTTATVCALAGDALFVAQVGDSRAYLLRGGRLTQITRDQTLATLLMEQGQLTKEELPTFAFNNVILQALGTTPRVDVDLVRVTVRRGDVLLICSDGLSGPVDDEVIRATLEGAESPVEAAEALIALANAAGGPDNVTAIVARIEGDALGVEDDAVVPLRGGGLEPKGLDLDLDPARAITPDLQASAAVGDPAAPCSTLDDGEDPERPRRSALGRVIAFLRGALRPSGD
jgi:protein phosphatase